MYFITILLKFRNQLIKLTTNLTSVTDVVRTGTTFSTDAGGIGGLTRK
jgi:hypothetical protein